MEKLIAVIKSIFEDFNEEDFREDMALEEIDGWDSMNSVNFELELESSFGIDLSDVIFTAEEKISDVILVLKTKGIDISEESVGQ
jgi:acyl carrier protein